MSMTYMDPRVFDIRNGVGRRHKYSRTIFKCSGC